MPDPTPTPPQSNTSGIIVENGHHIQRVPGMPDLDLGPVGGNSDPFASAGQSLIQNPMGRRLTKAVANPEGMALVASLLAPEFAPVLLPAAVGAGTSVIQDLAGGERDPLTIAGGAVGHGLINAGPGLVGKMVTRGANAADVAAGALRGGPKGGLFAYLKGLFNGPEVAAKPAASGLADMTTKAGTPVLSQGGLRELIQEEQKRALAGGHLGDPMYRALDDLISQVKQQLAAHVPAPTELASRAGLPVRSLAAEEAAKAAAARTAQGQSVAMQIRKLLYPASGAYELTRTDSTR